MKPIMRYRSQLLFRRSFKPNQNLHVAPAKLNFVFRQVGFGQKPQLKTYESHR